MLTGFSLENFRSFADKTEIELRPLTLLFGYNSAGKSALLRLLALLSDSARAGDRGILDLSSEPVRKGGFNDLRCKVGGREAIRLGLSFEEGERVEAEIAEDQRTRRLIASELRLSLEAHTVVARWAPEGPDAEKPGHELSVDGAPAGKVRLGLSGLAPSIEMATWDGSVAQEKRVALARDMSAHLRVLVADMIRHFQWLSSVRQVPLRYGRYEGGPPERMQPDGGGVAEILAYDKLDGGPLLPYVSLWYERCFKRRLEVDQSPDERFAVTLESIDASRKEERINIADTGEGMAQVLPVLVALAMAFRRGARDPWTLAMEQPELHLHPEVHAPLAEQFCQLAAEDKPPRTLIETHSGNFLLGVQIQIAKRMLPADRVLVYWVRQLDDGRSVTTTITFDDEGRPHGGWPPGVFSEDVELTRELIRERKARKSP